VDDLTLFTKSKPNNFTVETKVFLIVKDHKKTSPNCFLQRYMLSISQHQLPTSNAVSALFSVPQTLRLVLKIPKKNNIQVFVNAANQITIIAPEKCNYAIYNAVGQQVENGVTTAKQQTVNCKINTSVYVVKVGNQSTRVIIK
jgi:hypothetical protein